MIANSTAKTTEVIMLQSYENILGVFLPLTIAVVVLAVFVTLIGKIVSLRDDGEVEETEKNEIIEKEGLLEKIKKMFVKEVM